jgi:hypothetical protein
VITIYGGWQVWQAYTHLVGLSRQHTAMTYRVGLIMLFDEVLTMSASMVAATGDVSYETRYVSFEPLLDKEFNAFWSQISDPEIELFVKETNEANLALGKMNRAAFALVHQGRRQKAMSLLTGDDYSKLKNIYAGGIQKTLNAVIGIIEMDTEHMISLFRIFVIFSSLGVFILLCTWLYTVKSGRRWAEERMASEKALQIARDDLEVRVKDCTADLLYVNKQLTVEVIERKKAEEKIHDLAFYDTLTNLPNRRCSLTDSCKQWLTASAPVITVH